MRPTCRVLKSLTHNSIHLITPFDSGGSSATLRAAFGMVSVGDVRNRLLALAEDEVPGSASICALFAKRLAADGKAADLRSELRDLCAGRHANVATLRPQPRSVVQHHLEWFHRRMPPEFDLRGASVGNLILAGGYLEFGRDLNAVVANISRLLGVRGHVRTVSEAALDLRAELVDGTAVVGQHLITGKSEAPIRSAIAGLDLVDETGQIAAGPRRRASQEILDLISEAELICYPLGSFWTSVVANLLPSGIGRAIHCSSAPKVLLANSGEDPEMLGMKIHDCVDRLRESVHRDVGGDLEAVRGVDRVVVDVQNGDYRDRLDLEALTTRGLELIDLPLVTSVGQPTLDPIPLAEALISMAASA